MLETAWSDRSPVLVLICSLSSPTASYICRLKESLLSNQANCLDVELQLKEYFSLNDPTQTSPMCVWAAHKATVRCILIQIAAR